MTDKLPKGIIDDIRSAREAADKAVLEIAKERVRLRHVKNNLHGLIALMNIDDQLLNDLAVEEDAQLIKDLIERALQIRKALTDNKLEISGHSTAALIRLAGYRAAIAAIELGEEVSNEN